MKKMWINTNNRKSLRASNKGNSKMRAARERKEKPNRKFVLCSKGKF